MPKSRVKKHGSGKRYTQKPTRYDPLYTRQLRDDLRRKLKDNLTLEELVEMERQIRTAVEQAVQKSVVETHNRTWAIVFRVLHDRFGFEAEQKKVLYDSAVEYLYDIRDGHMTTAEMLETLLNEDGIQLSITWEDLI